MSLHFQIQCWRTEVQKNEGFSDELAASISGSLLGAGADTPSNTLYAFVQAMLLYPDVQREVQEHIDRVVGQDRLPTVEDEPNLPYIRSYMEETSRWMPTTILGAVPHATSADDTYNGYFIPKGAGLMNNVLAINMDSRRAPDPRKFVPSRYQNDPLSLHDSASNPDATKRDQFTFGAGRRIYQGMHVAERSLFLGMARILAAFDIKPALDPQGKPIIPDQEKFTQGFACMPEEYPARITPRSKAKAKLIIQEWEEAEKTCLDPETKQWIKSPVRGVMGVK